MKFEETIKKYLEDYANKEEQFKTKYQNPNKNIKECCKYIISEAKKKAEKNCAILPDDEVYYMARHYYEEENIKIDDVKAKVEMSSDSEEEDDNEKHTTNEKKVSKKAKTQEVEQITLF